MKARRVPHYSCGICIAATFGLPTRPFQALRKGGVTGEGKCGAIVAGRLVIGYFLGDPEPHGRAPPAAAGGDGSFRTAMERTHRARSGFEKRCNTRHHL